MAEANIACPISTIPLLISMCVAIVSTKIPILLGHVFLCFHVAKLARYGFWGMASESRTDFSMVMGLLFCSSQALDVFQRMPAYIKD